MNARAAAVGVPQTAGVGCRASLHHLGAAHHDVAQVHAGKGAVYLCAYLLLFIELLGAPAGDALGDGFGGPGGGEGVHAHMVQVLMHHSFR